jgi:hypothetical protein
MVMFGPFFELPVPGVGWSPTCGWAAIAGGGAATGLAAANRRLTVRYERRADLLTAFLHLACALICAYRLGRVDTA